MQAPLIMDPQPVFKKLSNGVMMPVFGLGTWQLNTEKLCSDAVQTALAHGVRLIDSASAYRNEAILGKILSQFKGFNDGLLETANGNCVFITSKAGPSEMGFDKTYEACLRSLHAFGQNAIDLYLLHWPGASGLPHASPEHRKRRLEAWMALEKLYAEGKVRAIGVSNFMSHHLRELMEDGATIVPHVNQIEIHPLCPNTDVRRTDAGMGIVTQAYSSLGTGQAEVVGHPVVQQVAAREAKTCTQVLLRWAIQQGVCVIPRTTKPAHMTENLKVLAPDMALSDESMRQLNAIATDDDSTHVCWHAMAIP